MSVAIPGQVGLKCKALPGPHAMPAILQMQTTPDQISLFVVGGLTKRQHIATELLPSVLSSIPQEAEWPDTVKSAVAVAIQIADELLRQTEAPQPSADAPQGSSLLL